MGLLNVEIASLRARLPEISDYYARRKLRAEPFKYPKNLFKTQQGEHRYEIRHYLLEIDHSLKMLANKRTSSHEQDYQLKKVHQQILVLINTAKSSKRSFSHKGLLEELKEESSYSDKSALELLKARKLVNQSDNAKELERVERQLHRLKSKLAEQQKIHSAARNSKSVEQSEALIKGLNNAISLVEAERERIISLEN